MNLSEMRGWLAKRDIQLTKSLGQNFLHDGHQLQKIVAAAHLTPEDKVLEIGPGLGPLTELLLAKAGKVMAIEMDGRLVEFLEERFLDPESPTHRPNFELLHGDALHYLRDEPQDWSEWKLVANLPYSVASPVMVELSAGARAPKKMVVTLQMEVAQRLMAKADDDDYGLLTLLVQLDYEPGDWFKIPPGCFFPAPEVDSACIVMNRRTEPLLSEAQRAAFVRIVKRAFSQRRKMMMKLLKQDWPKEKLDAAFAELGISPQERAEKLSLKTFVELTKRLAGSS